jgi:hypothetical protein
MSVRESAEYGLQANRSGVPHRLFSFELREPVTPVQLGAEIRVDLQFDIHPGPVPLQLKATVHGRNQIRSRGVVRCGRREQAHGSPDDLDGDTPSAAMVPILR